MMLKKIVTFAISDVAVKMKTMYNKITSKEHWRVLTSSWYHQES